MVFQNAPTPLNRIILAVIGWVIGQPHGDPILLHKCDDALHKLGAATMILWPVIQIDHQRRDVPKPLPDRLPPVRQAIDQAITRDLGANPIQKQVVQSRQQNADGGDSCVGMEVMVGGCGWDATLPPTRKWTNFDGCFRVD